MAIAQKVAGFSLGQADILRRAMGKKKKSELDKQYAGFEKGMQDNGYSAAAIKTLWDILLPFSDYAFNKAHSAAYGVVSFWTAYLKAHYPAEYMAALLTGRRRRHPLRHGRDPQRRLQRRRRHREGPDGEGRVRVVPRLPAEDPDLVGEQADGRVAHQGRCLRRVR
jgi:hypothetical protein